jgi:hypothetical protein
MKLFPIYLSIFVLSMPVFAQDFSQANSMAQSAEVEKMKAKYESCVIKKGIAYAKVSTVTEAIKFAPIACKRELLAIKKFFLNSAFKTSIITDLVDSVRAGVEIDLIKKIYSEKLANAK